MCRAMAISFAALVYKAAQVSDQALAHGFAVALAGYDVPAPTLTVVELRGLPGYAAAFYRSGMKASGATAFEETDHTAELFEDELPPALAVRDAAGDAAVGDDAVVWSLVYSEEATLDDGAKVTASGYERHFVRDGDEGLEAGVETGEASDVTPLDPDADDAELAPHRGSTFLSKSLGVAIVPALVGALYEDGRRLVVRFFDPGATSIARETERLVAVLGRVKGRGAFEPPASLGGVARAPAYHAFVEAYDWADPSDPSDLYRELAIGRIEGTLKFSRMADLERIAADPSWKPAADAGLFPIAELVSSALGPARKGGRVIALAADGESLAIVDDRGVTNVAGPTFAELLAYLALGWKKRDDIEEDLIGALMLRAKLRAER